MLEDLFKTVRERFTDDTETKDAPQKIEIPEGLMFRCCRCGTVTDTGDLEKNMKICPACNYHTRLTWRERMDYTADKGSFVELDADMTSKNPISFPGYEQKITELQEKCGLKDAIVTGTCTIYGYRAVIGIMDSSFMMASMGSVVGEKVTRAFEYATREHLPVILFTASGGARMQEGIVSLMQMAKTSGAIAKFSEDGGLYVTILTDPTTGGVTASFASLGDIIIAEPKVLIGFAGRRVIQDTIKQKLPDDFQTAEFLLDSGFVDSIVDRRRMRRVLARILKIHRCKKEEVAD